MNPLLVALDVDSARQALDLADELRDMVGGFKVGSQLFTAEGPSIVSALAERGDRVFLDLKFHDIPNTVAGAVASAARRGVWMLTIHASGGRAMMQAAREAADHAASAPPLIVGVTVLTSHAEAGLAEVGVSRQLDAQVMGLAALAQSARLDGVVASPLETRRLRRACGPTFTIVTPGIRHRPTVRSETRDTGASSKDDQARTLTAAEAIGAGATYVVIGRPIVAAPDPREAAARFRAELDAAHDP